MHFVIHCLDTADPSIRQTHYPAHRAYLAAAPLKILIAGPLLDEAGEAPIGSLLVIEAETMEAARAFASGDPFAVNGAWDSIRIYPFTKSVENR
ncbi:YciI family protein [Methylobacterium sp. NEAU K]|uniref:YciI family protein n=1 Tax=Methylobacterium sp. NEAU K TaxID=3064946 RepID=UPI002732BFAC|nr:YciI family protein [Methylobacterium sp. NEAU K]MDP4003969.1 YciI family protein [Methylobacterium sp. NEAU K]